MITDLTAGVPVDLLLDLDLGSARGGKRPLQVIQAEFVRSLETADLPELQAPAKVGAEFRPVDKIRASHHQLAQLLAKGQGQLEAGLITGYSQAYISSLVNHDPAFQELLAHYATEREMVFVDVLETMKALGIETLEMLRDSIREDPGKWSNREKMELAELMLVKPMVASKGTNVGPGVQIGKLEVSFVAASGGKIIEGEFIDG